MKKVNSFEEACAITGYNAKDNHTVEQKLEIIALAIKGKWRANWAEWTQYKWYPWFLYNKNTAAFRFVGSDCDDAASDASVGSRFVFETKAQADHFGKQFEALHSELLLRQIEPLKIASPKKKVLKKPKSKPANKKVTKSTKAKK